MHPPGVFQLLVVALIVLILFGRGRISALMGDFGKGVKNFRKSLADEDETVRPVQVDGPGIDVGPTGDPAIEPPAAPDQTHT